jgi:hypothetical protein
MQTSLKDGTLPRTNTSSLIDPSDPVLRSTSSICSSQSSLGTIRNPMLMSAKAKDTFRSAYVCMYQKKENDVRKRRKRVAIVASVGDALTILSVNSSNSNTQ